MTRKSKFDVSPFVVKQMCLDWSERNSKEMCLKFIQYIACNMIVKEEKKK